MFGDSNSKPMVEVDSVSIVTWQSGTYEEISKMLEAHYKGDINIANYWSVGDTRTESISEIPSGTTGEEQSAQSIDLIIIGFNHDDMVTGIYNITKAAITVQTVNCLTTKGYLSNNRYVSNTSGTVRWSSSSRRTWCNSDFYNALNVDLRNLVKQVIKTSNRGTHVDYTNYVLSETTNDFVFMLSQAEVFDSMASIYNDNKDGIQYKYMKIGAANRVKYLSGTLYDWWLRTSYATSKIFFMVVNTTGDGMDSPYANNSNYGIAPAFCL